MLTYDGSKVPFLAIGAAETIARQSPTHMIGMIENTRDRCDDERLRLRLDGYLLAFRAFVHRCEIAMRRIEGATVKVDPLITANGDDMRVDIAVGVRKHIIEALRGSIGFANDYAVIYRDNLAPTIGHALDPVGEKLQGEVHMAEESAKRLQYALEAFEM